MRYPAISSLDGVRAADTNYREEAKYAKRAEVRLRSKRAEAPSRRLSELSGNVAARCGREQRLWRARASAPLALLAFVGGDPPLFLLSALFASSR
jgi:hypothetical protein